MSNQKLKIKILTVDVELEFESSAKTSCKELFVQVSKNLGMHEIWFFGLTYQDSNGDEIWIDNSKKTLKVHASYLQKLNYKVKYYPENIEDELIEDTTIKYFFLQVRTAILADKIYCPPDTCVLLASYASQARHGDCNPTIHNTDFLGKQTLLPKRVYEQHNMRQDEFYESILSMWKKHRGMLKEDAMMEYLKLSQNLEMYGVQFYDITNNKGTPLLLGIHAIGLSIYKSDDRMNPTIMFPWSEIKNINYRDRKFTIKTVDKQSKDFIFFSVDAKTNKRILGLGVGNHYLYVKRRSPDTLEVTQMRTKAQQQRKVLLEQREKLQSEISARQEAEEREKNYQDEIKRLKEEMEQSQRNLFEAQNKIRKLEEQLLELQKAKEELEKQQMELQEMMKKYEESKYMEEEERRKLEEEIAAKQLEVQRIQEEVNSKNEETLRLQEEVERARRHEEELMEAQMAEAARKEEEERLMLESEQNNEVKDDLPELVVTNEQLKEQLKILQEKLEHSRDETKETDLDKLHRDNVREGRNKYKTLAEIRKGNTVRRVDLFENL